MQILVENLDGSIISVAPEGSEEIRQYGLDLGDIVTLYEGIELPEGFPSDIGEANLLYKYLNGSFVFQEDGLSYQIRQERYNKITQEVDPLVMNPLRWNSMTAEQQQEWTDYRQALLDVPQQEGFPLSVTWPVKPNT